MAGINCKGTYHLQGKESNNTGWKIKSFTPSTLESFRKNRL